MKKLMIVTVALFLLAFAACGNDDNPTIESGDSGANHNEADIEFARSMIVHHQQAIEMSATVRERGENAAVDALATRIEEAQAPEVKLMRGWLASWDVKESSGMAGHGGGANDETMMSEDEMNRLEAATGSDLDRLFLEMMIRHHEGAISMAETELEDGEFPAAKDLAEKIIAAQRAEIAEMRQLLEEI